MRKEARDAAEAELDALRGGIRERDEQIYRLSDQISNLQQQVRQSQSELKGETGELDLYATLTQAFPTDVFRRQQRGTATADLVQIIRLASGTALDIPIAYDNKAASAITKHDVEKAKHYREVHGTNYVILVCDHLPREVKNGCDHLPREVKNGYYGERDGILLVHSKIVVDVARTLRSAIIEIAKQSESRKDRQAKGSSFTTT